MRRFTENITLMSVLTIYYCIAQTCKEQEIYNFLSSSCLKCSSECQSCFNIGSSQCISCSQNSYQSYDDVSTCLKQCQKNEFVDSVSQRCTKCKVTGCVKCNSEQICEECDENLELDQENNQCNTKKDNCQFSLQFMIPFSDNKCLNSCPQSYYQNYSNYICEQTQKCPQIQQVSASVINGNINSISFFQENQYIIQSGGSCSFAIIDKNWNVITKQTIQEKNIFGRFGRISDTSFQSLVSGIYGVCLQGRRLNVINFETLQIEFDDPNLAYYYNIRYVDNKNKLVFMTQTNLQALTWYDFKNKKINQIQIDFYANNLDKFLKSYYLYSIEENKLLNIELNFFKNKIANFYEEDSSIKIQISKQKIQFFPQKVLFQKDNYALFYYGLQDNNYIYRIIFDEEGQILESVVIYQFTMGLIEQNIFSSNSLNLILLYSNNNNEMTFLQFNEQLDQILINETIITDGYINIITSDNLMLNSFYIFVQEKELYQFGNITDALVQYSITKQLTINYKSINQIFIHYYVHEFWIFKDEIQIIFSKYQLNSELFGLFNTCIRYRYNFVLDTTQFQYLNPYQFLFISENLFDYTISVQKYVNVLPQNKIVINKSQKPLFYTVNYSNLLQNVLVSKQNIIKQIAYLQKNPRILTTVSQDLPIKNAQLMTSRIIENQILITSVPFGDELINEYVTDIKNQKIILNYSVSTFLSKSILYYIKSKNLLVVENNMIIYNLNNSKIFANLADVYGNAVNIEDRILIILNIEGQSLHQLDLVTADIEKIFDFTEDFRNFMLIDQANKLPVIFDGDIIYLQDSYFSFQPFSINQRKLLYKQVDLGIFYNSQFITLNIKKEIFIIAFSYIKIYSFDLQDLGIVQSGNFLDNFFYDDSFIYFCVFDFFYKLDLVNRKLINLEIINTSISLQPLELEINFYRLDDSNYFKQQEIIIDSKNMIIIKSQQEKNLYIGQIQQGDQQLHFFQSQNEFYWHINLFNIPYRILNLKTQNQIFLSQQFDQSQNIIAIYDNTDNQITIYNQINIYKTVQIDFNMQSDLNTYVLDWTTSELIYVTNDTLYLFSPFSTIKNSQISVLDSKITQYKICNKQGIIIALTSQKYIYSINVKFTLKSIIQTKLFIFYQIDARQQQQDRNQFKLNDLFKCY